MCVCLVSTFNRRYNGAQETVVVKNYTWRPTKLWSLSKIFPLFKDMCFSLPHHLTVTVLNIAKQDARHRVTLHTNCLLRRKNYQMKLSTCDMFLAQLKKNNPKYTHCKFIFCSILIDFIYCIISRLRIAYSILHCHLNTLLIKIVL